MAAVSLWALLAFFEVFSNDPQTKIFSYGLKYLFIVVVPLAWLVFSLYYANRVRRLRLSFLTAIALLPTATLILVATNPLHHRMFTSFDIVAAGNHYVMYARFGPWFWVHTVYSYGCIAAGFLLLTRHLLSTPAHFKRQVASLMIACAAPWISNAIFLFKPDLLHYFDMTPIAFSVSGIVFMWGILRYRLLDIVPIARDTVIQNMDDCVIIVDTDMHIIDLNPAACTLIGRPVRDLIGAHADQVVEWWPSYLSQINQSDAAAFTPIELNVNGRHRSFNPVRSCLFSKDKLIGYLIILRDVTGRLEAEKALRNSEERFKSLSENAPVIIFALDENGTVSYVNQAWERILGHERGRLPGKLFVDIIEPEEEQSYTTIFDRLLNGQQSVAEIKFHVRHRDGLSRLFNATVTANSDADGRIIGIIGLAKDVTEAKRLQEQLFQSQKMKAVGTLAGGIAHDFNNLLMGIQANVSLMRNEIIPSKAVITEKLNRIEDQIQCGAALTRQLLGYAHKGKRIVDSIKLNNLIEETLNVVERTNKKITVNCELTRAPSYIKADKGQIELVLLNLFLNAVDAMPGGGRLTVSSRLVSSAELTCQWPPLKKGHYFELTINDNGIGMDEETKRRIFEPFFTTKDLGQGTGLGLASVYGIVENHGGHIQVESQPGRGATFQILLPATETKVAAISSQPATPIPGGGRILLVDDEELILKYCHEMIQSLGYDVLSTTKPREAISIYRDRQKDFDLVILDIIMPEMDGIEVFERMASINPEIKAIITSGYSDDCRIERILAGGRHDHLKKPFTRQQLSRSISRVLDLQGDVSPFARIDAL
jgi:PAS domain S-box-containing protein